MLYYKHKLVEKVPRFEEQCQEDTQMTTQARLNNDKPLVFRDRQMVVRNGVVMTLEEAIACDKDERH